VIDYAPAMFMFRDISGIKVGAIGSQWQWARHQKEIETNNGDILAVIISQDIPTMIQIRIPAAVEITTQIQTRIKIKEMKIDHIEI